MGGGSNRDSASCLYTGSVEGNTESLGINFRPNFKTKSIGNVILFEEMISREKASGFEEACSEEEVMGLSGKIP
jgi:hypothetical protein